jgi:tRNA (guanine37-N1)-methyltransferase
MRFAVVTLFPDMFAGFAELGVVGRAIKAGDISVSFASPRDFGLGKHRSVDDTPYGGGAGMVMRVDCMVDCLESLPAAHRVLMSPQGAVFDQAKARQLATLPAVTLVCGRYEGVDERVRTFVDEEISLGDFVMSGGEIAAMAIIDSVARHLPGVLGNAASLDEESHSPATGGLLEYPHYTRPAVFRGHAVPEVLQGGNHAAIRAWRDGAALERTRLRRPDIPTPSGDDP